MVLRVEYLDYQDHIKSKGGIACLGFFDGLHIAHQELIKKGQLIKKETNKPLFVFTFDQSIGKYLNNKPFYYLTSIEDKKALLKEFDVDVLYVFKVSKEFISLSPDDFIRQYLIDMSHIVVGFDFTYGFRSLGTVDDLLKYKEFETTILPEITYQADKIGSTIIRKYLDEGEMDLANYLLGRNYQIKGEVIHGMGMGKKLGFPTANIDFTNYYLPKLGVYLTKIVIGNQSYYGVTNVGKKPTFKDQSISLEAYIFDLNRDLYGQMISIEFIEFMRDEIRYSNKEALIKQINKDVERAKRILSRRSL
ncbi:bifunctional riboflavin kinase/FAD synthetase [Mycoplasmatota bacterium]|nr:bifunctional riboflavin kinase/FAD synthetase [Mycoplasmatota bacterium]